MIRRVHQLGETRSVEVMEVQPGFCLCRAADDPTEAFVLMGISLDSVIAGQRREIEFRSGGPTGGHWSFR